MEKGYEMGNSQKQQHQQADYERHLIPLDVGLSGTLPVILFTSDAVFSRGNTSTRRLGEKFHLTFKLVHTECKIVKSLLAAYGFNEVHPSSPDFNLTWTNSHIKPGTLHSMTEYQKVNHFPRSFELTRKDRLYKNIQRMQHIKGAGSFDFIPQSFLIPMEYVEFCSEFRKWRGLWIVKPLALSRGRGIFIISKPDELRAEEPVLVAKYIDNPLLINGYKFDLRLYVAVTSFDPLVVYLYKEGLARFATEKYRKGVRHLSNQCMHLTNYSVNRHSANYVRCYDPNVDDYGNKWSLSALWSYLEKQGCSTTALLAQIKDIIIKAFLSAQVPIAAACRMEVPSLGNCFELFGFDILLDDSFRPWLLEINFSPSLACDMPLDLKIKSKLVADLLTLTGIVAHDPLLLRFQQKKTSSSWHGVPRSKQHRLSGSDSTQSSKSVARTASSKDSFAIGWEETARITRVIHEEVQRCGDFVRIFPTPNTWEVYGSYFDNSQGYTAILHKSLYPSVSKFVLDSMCKGKAVYRNFKDQSHPFPRKLVHAKRLMSAALSSAPRPNAAVLRGGMLGGGEASHKSDGGSISSQPSSSSEACSMDSSSLSSAWDEVNPVVRLLRMDETLSQVQSRRVFGLYLFKVGERLQTIMEKEPLEKDRRAAEYFHKQMDLVFQFLIYASENLAFRIRIVSPDDSRGIYEEGRQLLAQLKVFLKAYTQETEKMSERVGADDREYFVRRDVFEKFIRFAKASELEEVLMIICEHHSTSWFLGNKIRNSSLNENRLPPLPNGPEVGVGELRRFHYFFPRHGSANP